MRASAISDAFVTLLSAASVYGSGFVSKGKYDILETTSGSCAVIFSTGVTSTETAFGARDRDWSYTIENFFKFTGDVDAMTHMATCALDLVVATLESDPTIQGTAAGIGSIQGRIPPFANVEAAGAYWMLFPMTLTVKEFV